MLSEESVPCPGTVPTSPAEAMLASHRAEARRLVSSELGPEHDSVHAPDQPPSARQLWEQQALEGELAISLDLLTGFSYIIYAERWPHQPIA